VGFRVNKEREGRGKKKGRTYFFAVYEYSESSAFLKHYLYNNHRDGEYLLPEFKHLDFLWLLKDDFVSDESLQHLVQSIRTVNGVQLVIELTNEKIKNKDHLVF
jgi:hypothetical protein